MNQKEIINKIYPQNGDNLVKVKLDKEHSPYKIVTHNEMIRKFIKDGKFSPIHFRVGLTNQCNLRCKFCNFHSVNEKAFYDAFQYKDKIDKEIAIKFIKEFAWQGGKAITFCGSGECTVHPDYSEICYKTKDKGIEIGLITNGTMLSNIKIMQCIIDTHTWVRVGLNAGNKKTFKTITGADECMFDNIIKSVKQIKEKADNPEFKIGFNFVITMDNFNEIVSAAKLAKENRLDYIRFEPEFYSALAHRTIYDHIQNISDLLDEAKLLIDEKFEVSIPKLDRGAMTQTEKIEGNFQECHYSKFVTALGADACVYPCPQIHMNKEYNMGSIKNGYLKWYESEEHKLWREQHKDRTQMCKTCFYRPQNELLENIKKNKLSIDDLKKIIDDKNIPHKNFV